MLIAHLKFGSNRQLERPTKSLLLKRFPIGKIMTGKIPMPRVFFNFYFCTSVLFFCPRRRSNRVKSSIGGEVSGRRVIVPSALD